MTENPEPKKEVRKNIAVLVQKDCETWQMLQARYFTSEEGKKDLPRLIENGVVKNGDTIMTVRVSKPLVIKAQKQQVKINFEATE